MARSSQTTDVEWLRALWVECAELEKETGMAIRLVLRPTARKGVFRATAQALIEVESRGVAVNCKVSSEYPTSDMVSFAAGLSRLIYSLAEECAADPLNKA